MPAQRGVGMREVVIFQSEDGQTRLTVQLEKETVWLNLNQMADLFGRDKSVISRHLNTIFKSGELVREATVAKNATVQSEGGRAVRREIDYFNLAVFIFFLARNAILYRADGSKRLADNALVALTLLIAENRPEEKDTIVKVIVNLINRSNA